MKKFIKHIKTVAKSEYNRKLSEIQLKKTPITESNLLVYGFERDSNNFLMGDLIIFKIGSDFYFKNIDSHLEQIKNSQQVSDLVCGNTQYFR